MTSGNFELRDEPPYTAPRSQRLRAFGLTLALSILSFPGHGVAQTAGQSSVELNYPNLRLHFTLPDGFCSAAGPYADLAKKAFEAQPDQVLLVAAFRCQTMAAKQSPQESFTIKTSRETLGLDAGDRSSFAKSGPLTNGGRDEYGQYTSAESTLKLGNAVAYQVQSGAMTSIKHRLIVLSYSNASLIQTANKAEALQFIKTQTHKLVEENER